MSLQLTAATLSSLLKELREQVSLSNQVSSDLAQVEPLLARKPPDKAALASNLSKIERAYQDCVAAVEAARRLKADAEAKGLESVAVHLNIPNPSAATLLRLEQRLHAAIKEFVGQLGPAELA